MSDIHTRLEALGTAVPEILLPNDGIDLSKWAVIACDQYTQDRDYWERAADTAKGLPSCINLIFPEVYLEEGTEESLNLRIAGIRDSMKSYLGGGVFAPPRNCCVYIERSTAQHPRRRGLVLAVDLEKYDWKPGSRALIRSTEGTVPERLPPRVKIRQGAPLDLPHILLLIDDEEDKLIPGLGELAKKKAPLYESPLMMNSGAISGWALEDEEALEALAEGLEGLTSRMPAGGGSAGSGAADSVSAGLMNAGESPFLFAVGDGNHSLATAKAVWEEYKKNHPGEVGLENHPARWALVEVENLYDPGISFEPIHRVIFGPEPEELFEALAGLKGLRFHREPGNLIRVESLSPAIATAELQPLLDDFVKRKGYSIDYIHGEEELLRLCEDPSRRAVGLILPPLKKEGLFKTVAESGPLPRKSFSMGSAWEKRFYLECRRLFG